MAERRWIMAQTWEHLCFLHWPVDAAALRPHIPPGLSLDTFDGAAWIGVVPFTMRGIRLRGLPAVPGTRAFHELNVRTYVTRNGTPGVWFFSLDAANRLAVWVARRWFHLNYVWARMSLDLDGDAVRYQSHRRRPADGHGSFVARYRPTGDAFVSTAGSLEFFLTERYYLYAESRRGQLFRGDIEHPPWPLQPAECEVSANTMGTVNGLTGGAALPDPLRPPLCHFSHRMDMVAFAPQRVTH